MDQALKARLIGAAVLVALAVLLIPELLSGRKPAGTDDGAPPASRGTRTFTIELAAGTPAPAARPIPTSAPGVVPAQASPASRDAAPDSGLATPPAMPSAAAARTTPHPAPAATAPAATPASSPAATPSPARGGWAVQVGAFGSAATAQKMADQLKAAGYRAYVSPVARSGKTLHRVRVGPEAERARAEGLAASLKARDLPATVVAND